LCCVAFKVNKCRYKGPFQWQDNGRKRDGLPAGDEQAAQEERQRSTATKDPTLNNVLLSIAVDEADDDDNSRKELAPLLLKAADTVKSPPLIEETKLKPLHEIENVAGETTALIIRVHLPRESTSVGFELSTSVQDILLDTPNYRLELSIFNDMSAPINAQFDVDSRVLTIRLQQPPAADDSALSSTN
jgi:hypothetical protein